MVKNTPANTGVKSNVASITGLERFPGGGYGNPLQYSCLANPDGQRSLANYRPSGRKELDMTECTCPTPINLLTT